MHHEQQATRTGRGAVTRVSRQFDVSAPIEVSGPFKEGDRMMVITQSCDLIKPAVELPQVEVARVFETTNRPTIANAMHFGSARFFRLDEDEAESGVILDYGQRAFLEKGFLEAVAPDNSLCGRWTDERRRTFARWLGQRYSRPAVPDDDYKCITSPVREAWRTLLAEEPETAAAFNREYAEWRYRREPDGSLTVYILSASPEPDEGIALEVSDFLVSALEPAYPGPVLVATDHRSYHSFTKADELSSEQISMEWASQDEAGPDQALPG